MLVQFLVHIHHIEVCIFVYYVYFVVIIHGIIIYYFIICLCTCVFIAYVIWVYSKSSIDWKSFQTGEHHSRFWQNISSYIILNRDCAFALVFEQVIVATHIACSILRIHLNGDYIIDFAINILQKRDDLVMYIVVWGRGEGREGMLGGQKYSLAQV